MLCSLYRRQHDKRADIVGEGEVWSGGRVGEGGSWGTGTRDGGEGEIAPNSVRSYIYT